MVKELETLYECTCPECGKKVDAKIKYDEDEMEEEFQKGNHQEESLNGFLHGVELKKFQDKSEMEQL